MRKTPVAIIGSGNIGTDLMIKIQTLSPLLRVSALAGIEEASDGLKRGREIGVATTHEGLDGLLKMPEFTAVKVVFDATSAAAHRHHNETLIRHHKQVVDLTPAAIGPCIIPLVNLDEHLHASNVNMVTCGGQATIPIVYAVNRVNKVIYAEIVASISSKSAGPGTRANIDEFTKTTSRAIEQLGGAQRGKAIIVLNPAEPPVIMRDTVFCLTQSADKLAIEKSVAAVVGKVQRYVPGYRLKQAVQFDVVDDLLIAEMGARHSGTKVSVFLEVEGAAHYLPAYAGNLDIMTSAAMKTAERLVGARAGEMAV